MSNVHVHFCVRLFNRSCFFMQNCVGYGVVVLYIFRKPAASIFLVILFLTAKMQICDFRMFCNFCFCLCTCNTMEILKLKHYDNIIVFISHMNRVKTQTLAVWLYSGNAFTLALFTVLLLYYIDMSVIQENTPLVKFSGHMGWK